MKYASALLAFVALSAVCLGQWSEPVSISDTALNYPEGFQLVAGGGDTLWAVYQGVSGVPGASCMFAHRSVGDSWSGPETLATGTHWFYPASGVDPYGRVWLAWCHTIPMPLGDTLGIYTCMHDSSGWDTVRLALSTGGMDYLGFAADKDGNWYMGFAEDGGLFPHFYSYAAYSLFQANRWQAPRVIAGGLDSTSYGRPTLVVRPDTGVWAVYGRYTWATLDWVVVDHIVPPDSHANCRVLYDLAGWTATCDSAGQMWIVYVDTLGAIRSITIDVTTERRRQLVSTDHRWAAPQVCTDAVGWVWAFWSRSDTSLVVSCNWGNSWSEPEVVTGKTGYPVDIVSDQHGRIYVCFRDTQGRYWTCYRTSRPGISDAGSPTRRLATRGASVVRVAPHDATMYDAMGRRAADARSGLFFVREGPAQAVRKVVIQK